MSRVVRIVTAGMLTTVQDLGRWGSQTLGVPVAGPMDPYSHRLANEIVGNPAGAATLEVTLIGPELEFEGTAGFAVTGAVFDLELDGVVIEPGVLHAARPGSRLRFGARRRGARAYLAVHGGFEVPCVFGSRATHLVAATGGLEGRSLRPADRLHIGPPAGRVPIGTRRPLATLPDGGGRLRVLWGPHEDRFTDVARSFLQSARYTISTQSNRMGYRLEGPALQHAGSPDLISDATPVGALQVPASGQPILLMADRQTTGGYPIIATVITADLHVAGQLAPGDRITFSVCDLAAAMQALIVQERTLLRKVDPAPHRSRTSASGTSS